MRNHGVEKISKLFLKHKRKCNSHANRMVDNRIVSIERGQITIEYKKCRSASQNMEWQSPVKV